MSLSPKNEATIQILFYTWKQLARLELLPMDLRSSLVARLLMVVFRDLSGLEVVVVVALSGLTADAERDYDK